jgi:hypothetical protein
MLFKTNDYIYVGYIISFKTGLHSKFKLIHKIFIIGNISKIAPPRELITNVFHGNT